MSKIARIALGQFNPCLGDIMGNIEKIKDFINTAKDYKADIIAFPELAITGYPPEDLLLRPQFIDDNINALMSLARNVDDIIAIVGFVDSSDDIYNALAVIHKKEIIHRYHKIFLPTYSVFDEDRYFKAGNSCPIIKTNDFSFGVNICEDIWHPNGPSYWQSLSGAELIININASPFYAGKSDFKKKMLCTRANDYLVYIAHVNSFGGQDELVFDGGSMIIDCGGNIIAEARRFDEDLLIADIDLGDVYNKRLHDPRRRKRNAFNTLYPIETILINNKSISRKKPRINIVPVQTQCSIEEEIYNALVIGTRDYVKKNSFQKVCIGLSGGIDSSLTAKIAVDALGADNVLGVLMPSRFTSQESIEDANELAQRLKIKSIELSIMDIFDAYLSTLSKVFENLKTDLTEENLQARIRGNILMALSNKFNYLVLTTGNKSELSVGYATLYGDMAGGFAVLKDLSKTMVYKICHWINDSSGQIVIPKRVLTKEPTAELRENQKDSDSLPPYDELDIIIEFYIEQDRTISEIIDLSKINPNTVIKTIKMIDQSEYKRRQSPPGVKISQRAFGRDRRYPITNRYHKISDRTENLTKSSGKGW
ncbi:MAG TPA: NAD+ synthase [Nitrospirae bacterium]|nr:NAD+ synthase [Nitrospirota bacterium]